MTKKSRSRRAGLVVLALAVSAIGLTAVGGAGASGKAGPLAGQRFYLLIQSSPTTSKILQDHAIQILKKQGVDAQIKWNPTSSNVGIAQLQSGDVDGFSNAVAGGYSAVLAGIPIVDFALVNPREDYVFITRPDVNSLNDLKGKKIGVLDTTSINYPQALIALKSAKMDQTDVSIITAGGQSSRLAALIAGRVDATMLSHLSWLKVKDQGYHLLFDYTKQASALYDDTAWATASWLASHRDLAVAFNKALLQSYAWFDNPKNTQAVVNEAVGLAPGSDPTLVGQLFDILRSNHAYPVGQILNIPTLKYEAALFEQLGTVKGHKAVGTWANIYYAKKAKAQLYPPKKK